MKCLLFAITQVFGTNVSIRYDINTVWSKFVEISKSINIFFFFACFKGYLVKKSCIHETQTSADSAWRNTYTRRSRVRLSI